MTGFKAVLKAVLALASTVGAFAACSSSGVNQVTCTGGQSATQAAFSGGAFGTTVQASPFPATLAVSGVPAGGTLSGLQVRFNNYSADSNRNVGIMLRSPSGRNLQLLRDMRRGGAGTAVTFTFTLADGSAAVPCATGNFSVAGTYSPTNCITSDIGPPIGTTVGGTGATPNYGVSGTVNLASAMGTSTLNSTNGVFNGDSPNGTWSMYMAYDGPSLALPITWASYDLIINYTAASTPSTTTLTPSVTTLFRTAPSNTTVLTAQVTAGATGTITFKDGITNLTCTEGLQPRTLNGSAQATCTTSFSTEGTHLLSASYSGDGTFVSSSGSANVFVQSHSGSTGTTYCNTGAITNSGASGTLNTSTAPYPSVIFVGDGVNTDITNPVSTVSVQLKGLSSTFSPGIQMLLVAPDNAHAYEFWAFGAGAGALGTGDYTFVDGSTQLSSNSALSPGTYGPTSYSNTDVFTPSPPSPAPQPPATFSLAAPAGSPSKTFLQAFTGATAHGAWKLFLWDNGGPTSGASLATGWCLTITPATGNSTTVTVTSNPTPSAVKGSPVTFTATVASSPAVGNTGTVTFTENGAPLVGAPNGGVANVSGGVASISTSSLTEGDHLISAQYHDSTNVFADNFGTVTVRVDAATATPTLSGSTWTYCNPSVLTIPAGTVFANDFGPASPNPSNVFVSNLPGTVNTAGVTFKNITVMNQPNQLASLLVGPNGASAPTTAQTLDFFSFAGGINNYGPLAAVNFLDGATIAPQNSSPATNNGPASYGTASFTASPFFTLPAVQRAPTAGTAAFSTYHNILPNGIWSLYFNQNTHGTGSGLAGGWCVNFTVNPVNVTITKNHVGNGHGNFQQGQSGAQITIDVKNNGDVNGKGSTGDPDGLHPLTIVDTLNAAFTVGTLPTGTPWACSAAGQVVTCKSSNAIAATANYPQLIIPVNVSASAPATVANSVSASGGGITNTSSNTDNIVVDPAPVLAISKTHSATFTQGQAASWSLQVSNNSATSFGSTNGSTVTVTDTHPSGYTLNTASGSGWTCSGTTTITCTSTAVVNGAGGTFPVITLNVNVPANSPVSISNTAGVFGGGDLVHTNSGNAATSTDNVTVAQVPASITLTAGNNQSATVNTAFAANLGATVLDAASVAINGASVTFTAPGSGASAVFSNSTNTITTATNASGLASVPVTANTTAGGPYNVAVTAGSITNNFSLTNTAGAASAFTQNAGSDNQSATVLTAFASPLAVTIKDSFGNPISGKSVTFTAPGSGASAVFSNTTNTITVATNASGIASAPITANAVAGGPYTVTAASASLTTLNFSLTNNPGAANSVTANAGTTPQSATINTAFANALAVTVKDAGNNPISGVNVVFTAPGTGASGLFSNSTATITIATNASGVVSAPFTANGTAGGPYTVTATVAAITANFSLTNTAGSASAITANAGTTPQSATINTAFAVLAVTVKDAGNNPISGVNVVFTAPGTGASGLFSNSTATITIATNASGIASAPFTANGTAGGPYNVSATAGALSTNFSLTNTAGAAATITANAGTTPQSAQGNTAFANALAVTVRDAGSNPVSGVNVIFTAPGSGASGIFSNTTTSITVATNASGVAAAPFTANGTAGGPYSVTAVAGALNTSFSLTNTATGPVVNGNPVNQVVCATGTATFTASATGTPTPTVQWQVSTDGVNFNNIPGATSATLTLNGVTTGQNNTQYRAVFTNGGGSATTTAATLTVNTAPTVSGNPGNQSVTNGSLATFVAAANGQPTPTVQWQVSTDGVNFSNIPGATSTTYAFNASSANNNNLFRAVFTNTCGSATTTPATLTVTTGGTANLGAVIVKSGPADARVWAVQVTNVGAGTATNALVNSFSLTQTFGAGCTPVIGTALPIALGNIAPNGSASGNITIDFSSCAANVRFTMTTTFSSDGGTITGNLVLNNQFR